MYSFDVDICDLESEDIDCYNELTEYDEIKITLSEDAKKSYFYITEERIDLQNTKFFWDRIIEPIYKSILMDIFGDEYLTNMDGFMEQHYEIVDSACRDIYEPTVDIAGELIDIEEAIFILRPELYSNIAKNIVINQLNSVLEDLLNKGSIQIGDFIYTLIREEEEED